MKDVRGFEMEKMIGKINEYLLSQFVNQNLSKQIDSFCDARQTIIVGALQDYLSSTLPSQYSFSKVAGDLGVGLPPMIHC
jgi:hypothetical protein